ncbi:anti-sigma factor family protein [Streptomyces sp. NPDC001514]
MTVPPSGSPHVELLLGAYVLGALAPEEDAGVARHLACCDPCRAAYLDLADARALLAMVTVEDLLDGIEGIDRLDGFGGLDVSEDHDVPEDGGGPQGIGNP